MNISNNKILITGGGTGIGLGLAERFYSEGNTVIICGRRDGPLQEAKINFPDLVTKVCDISKEEERIKLFKWVAQEHPDLNILVNNAGVQNWMNVTDDDFDIKTTEEIAINVSAPLHLTSLLLGLKQITAVINVTSGLAFAPLAKTPVYCATKAFLRSFTLSLRYLLKERDIEVIEIVPPAIDTDLGGAGRHNGLPAVSEFVASIFDQLKAGKSELTFGTSEARVNANNETIAAYFKMLNP